MAATGNGNPAGVNINPANVEVSLTVQPLPLTKHNLKHLQPCIVRPMSPVTISSSHRATDFNDCCVPDCDISSGGAGNADNGIREKASGAMGLTTATIVVAAAKKAEAEVKWEQENMRATREVERLRFWVYSAMQTLLGLGPEGVAIVEADELYIAGPGDLRLKTRSPGDEATSARISVANQVVPSDDGATASNTKDVRDAEAACPPNHGILPNPTDPHYWREKAHRLTNLCKPLTQARRLERRRLAAEKDAQKKDAMNHSLPEELQENARIRAWQIEQKQLYRQKHSIILKWIQSIEAQSSTRSPSPVYDDDADQPMCSKGGTLYFERESDKVAAGSSGFYAAPLSYNSSIVEITPVQFVEATRDRNQQHTPEDSTAPTTAKGRRTSTSDPTTAPTTATNGNSENQPETKRQKNARSSTHRIHAAQRSFAETTSPELLGEPCLDMPQPTVEKYSGIKAEIRTNHSQAGWGASGKKRRRVASVDGDPHS